MFLASHSTVMGTNKHPLLCLSWFWLICLVPSILGRSLLVEPHSLDSKNNWGSICDQVEKLILEFSWLILWTFCFFYFFLSFFFFNHQFAYFVFLTRQFWCIQLELVSEVIEILSICDLSGLEWLLEDDVGLLSLWACWALCSLLV